MGYMEFRVRQIQDNLFQKSSILYLAGKHDLIAHSRVLARVSSRFRLIFFAIIFASEINDNTKWHMYIICINNISIEFRDIKN
jgi:hypothetical protein